MNAAVVPKKEEHSESSSGSDKARVSASSTPSNSSGKSDDDGISHDSQDDIKSENMNANKETEPVRMELRDRRKRKVTNYRYSPDLSPVNAIERKATAQSKTTVQSLSKTGSSSTEMSHWLQCDGCQKWRLVATRVFEELKALDHFTCTNLQGVTCKDRDDWVAGSSRGGNTNSLNGTAGANGSEDYIPKQRRKQAVRVNIFAGRFIPGFAGEFSEDEY